MADPAAPAPAAERPLRLLVIGAHHGVGAHVMRLARARGIDAVAFEGDALDAGAVSRAVAGREAVISTLGPRKGAPPDLCSRGTRNVVDAMRTSGARRLVQVTGAMVGHPRDKLGLVYRCILALASSAIRDRQKQEQIVVESGLDWTLVRPTRLTDDPPRGAWRDGDSERVGALSHIPRADVADALVRAVVDDSAIGRAWTLQL